MGDEHARWVRVASYGAGFEAELAVAQLRAAGLRAVARGNDIVGIFGPGFQGTTARGVDVLVLDDALAVARDVLGLR